MLGVTGIFTALVALAAGDPLPQGIPEPDAIVFGQVCLDGGSATDQDDVTIIARADVGGQLREVGRYKMGESPGASDCEGDADCYVLRIRLESVPPGTTASGNAVVISPGDPPPVQLYIVQGQKPEIPAAEVEISGRAMIRALHLRSAAPTADLNGDGQRNLVDHQVFLASLQGPAVKTVPACNPADLNSDGHVDMRDVALMQIGLTPSAP